MAQKFWDKVKVGGPHECWLWQGHLNRKGYGQVTIKGKNWRAHRYAWTDHNKRTIPPWPVVVMHSCDVRACCNPAHLSLGTQTENVADQDRKGGVHRARGKQHGRAKLTEADVLYIRSSTETDGELGKRFGVFATTVRSARTGKKWAHLPGATAPLPKKRKLTPGQVRELRARHKSGEDCQALGRSYGITQAFAWQIAKGHFYRDVNG